MSSFALHENGDCVDDILVKQLPPSGYDDHGEVNVFPQLPSDCIYDGEKFREPEILPRIGDEYQAELPPLIQEPNHMSYSESVHHSLQDFFIGLPIPLIWIKFAESELLYSTHPDYKNLSAIVTFCNGNIEPSHNSVKEIKSEEKRLMCSNGGYLLVPGLLNQSWSDDEKAGFLLALYIFEKNFVEVRRFVGSKDMGAILSFYYGEFYGSDVYHRWSEGRKTRSKKCVYGQRIFSGLRQQELTSRLLHKVSEEHKSALLKVSKTFSDEKMSLVEYVSSLKAMVGMKLLVEAIGIGSGKQDLTGMALEPLKSNQVTRSEIPAGKACSALTTSEIIKFLSGDYRLSKARSNDLFWEAVWPRLLARGWHSEQPQYRGYIAGSKCLVFLLPGVKKFSRRKLVKGDHYFDSVTDVLSKVVREPGLIELDNEEGDGDRKAEWGDDVKTEEEEKNPPTRQRYPYLQPRTPKRVVDLIKFTVVDTCLSGGKIRELRTLPTDISSVFASIDSREDSGKDTADESDAMNSITLHASAAKNKSGLKKHAHSDTNKPSLPSKKKRKNDTDDNQKPRKPSKPALSRKHKQGYVDNTAPISKRCRRLSDNSHEEARDARIENGTPCCSFDIHGSDENLLTQVSLSSPSESIDCPQMSNILPAEPQLLIDLNLPHVSSEFESNGPTNERDKQSMQPASSEQNTRRVSTRTRPPTTRALEALASGYLTVSRRKKGRDPSFLDAQPSKPPQQPRFTGPGSNESPCSSMASQIGDTSHITEGEKGTTTTATATTSGTSITESKPDNPLEANQEDPASKE